MASLAAHHQEQLANFLKFAAHKRAETLNEVDAAFSECIDTRLIATDYSEADVRDIIVQLGHVLKADLSKELEHASHVNVLVLQQVFQQVEGMDMHFTIDTAQLENHDLLAEMKEFETARNERRAMDAKLTLGADRGPSLAALTKDPSQHVNLVKRNTDLQDECRQWRQKYELLKQQALSSAQQGAALGAEREGMLAQFEHMSVEQREAAERAMELEGQIGVAKSDTSATLTLAQKLESTTADLMAAHEELDILKRSFGEKIDQSKQFQQLRKMITSKNDQLKEVRVRLARYESDDTPLAED